MESLVTTLQKTVLLRALTPKSIEDCLSSGVFRMKRYDKNNIIHFVGDRCSQLELILSGKVVVEHIDSSGNMMTITEFSNDDILSGNLMFSSDPYYPMTITAQQPVDILEIDRDQLFKLFYDHPEFLKTYLTFIADHTMILSNTIRYAVNQTIRERLIHYFNHERNRQKANPIRLTRTKKALAERLGVQRTSLSRELAKMKQDGLIDYDAEQITLFW